MSSPRLPGAEGHLTDPGDAGAFWGDQVPVGVLRPAPLSHRDPGNTRVQWAQRSWAPSAARGPPSDRGTLSPAKGYSWGRGGGAGPF